MKLRYTNIILGLVLILVAGCSGSPLAPQETAIPTPDPSKTLVCTNQSGKNDFCYVSETLAADTQKLERATIAYCDSKLDTYGSCSIMVWKNEASVARYTPLTQAETASMVAKFLRNPLTGYDCFQTYDAGQVVYSSTGCK